MSTNESFTQLTRMRVCAMNVEEMAKTISTMKDNGWPSPVEFSEPKTIAHKEQCVDARKGTVSCEVDIPSGIINNDAIVDFLVNAAGALQKQDENARLRAGIQTSTPRWG